MDASFTSLETRKQRILSSLRNFIRIVVFKNRISYYSTPTMILKSKV